MVEGERGRTSFVLSDEMRKYTDGVGFETKVHPYYYFMMLGFAHGKKGDVQKMDKDMVDTWKLGSDSPNSDVIGAIAFHEFCKDKGVAGQTMDDRILRQMQNFFHPDEAKKYTTEAYIFMNKYAQGGFDVMRSLSPAAPKDVYSFLLLFLNLMDEAGG